MDEEYTKEHAENNTSFSCCINTTGLFMFLPMRKTENNYLMLYVVSYTSTFMMKIKTLIKGKVMHITSPFYITHILPFQKLIVTNTLNLTT